MKDSQKQKIKKRFFKRKKPIPKKQKNKSVAISKKKQSFAGNLLFFLIPCILLFTFLTLYTLNNWLNIEIKANRLSSALSADMASFPVLNNYIEPVLSSKAALVLDPTSQTVLFTKNSNLRFSTASTAKIMTALVSLEYYQPDSVLIINSNRIEGTGLNLKRGDKFYFVDLLYAMLLPSANDAAVAIADNFPGGRDAFVAKMNEKSQVLHMSDTHFSDSIGIDDDGNYSTVLDMARLSAEAIKNEKFADIVGTRSKTILDVDKTHPYTFSNLNKLLGFQGVNGIKTGTTEGAGEVLVTSAVINDHTFIIVTMNSEDRFGDTSTLLDFIASSVEFVDLSR